MGRGTTGTEDGRPRFELRQVFSDGAEEIEILTLQQVTEQTREVAMGRRGFLGITALAATALLSACGPKPLESGKKCALIAHSGAVAGMDVSPDGTLLASIAADSAVKVWSMTDGAPVRELTVEQPPRAVTFTSDGSFLVCAGDGKTIRMWRTSFWDPAGEWEHDQNSVKALAMSHDGKILASGGSDGTVKIWNMEDSSAAPATLQGQHPVRTLAMSHDGKILASGSDDMVIRIFAVAEARETGQMKGSCPPKSIAFSRDGKLLFSGGDEKGVRVWNVADGSPVRRLKTDGFVRSVAISSDGTLLASGGVDKFISIHHTLDWALIRRLKTDAPVNRLTFSPNGRLLISGNDNGDVRLWNTSGEKASPDTCIPSRKPAPPPEPPRTTPPVNQPSTPSTGFSSTICTCNKVCTCIPVRRRKYCFVMFRGLRLAR